MSFSGPTFGGSVTVTGCGFPSRNLMATSLPWHKRWANRSKRRVLTAGGRYRSSGWQASRHDFERLPWPSTCPSSRARVLLSGPFPSWSGFWRDGSAGTTRLKPERPMLRSDWYGAPCCSGRARESFAAASLRLTRGNAPLPAARRKGRCRPRTSARFPQGATTRSRTAYFSGLTSTTSSTSASSPSTRTSSFTYHSGFPNLRTGHLTGEKCVFHKAPEPQAERHCSGTSTLCTSRAEQPVPAECTPDCTPTISRRYMKSDDTDFRASALANS